MRVVVNGRFSSRKTGVGRVIEGLFSALQDIDKENEYFIYVNPGFEAVLPAQNPNFHVRSNGIEAGSTIANHVWIQTVLPFHVWRLKASVLVLPGISLLGIKTSKVIYFQHDLIEYYLPNQRWHRLLFRRLAFPRTLRLADHVVCISENTRADVKKFFSVPDSKISVILCGVDQNLFRPSQSTQSRLLLQAEYGLTGDFILYVGTITHPQKNLIRVVDAFAVLGKERPGLKLVLVGGPGKDADAVYQHIADCGLPDRVVKLGYVKDEHLRHFYSEALLLCFPSLYEGFGLPIVEAMSCACPVVTSSGSSLKEVAGNAAILVDASDVASIAAGMREVIENPVLRADLVVRGSERASMLSWKNAANRFYALLSEIQGR
jgi:glycosyltransferase involved in cell wall biosynthesis